MSFKVVIPARYDSQRLPGKVMALLDERPVLAHVHDRACESGADEVWITSDNERVLQAARDAGARHVFLSAADHRSGTDRIAELAQARRWQAEDVVVNLQGDEPFMPGELIGQVGKALLERAGADIATACCAITDPEEFHNPNVVKVVRDQQDFGLYFSRSPIPFSRQSPGSLPAQGAWRHLGIYAYRVAALKRFAQARPQALEVCESLEQLRALALGMRILVVEAACIPGPGIDTDADLQRARLLLANKGAGL